jgi:hypothetical protein
MNIPVADIRALSIVGGEMFVRFPEHPRSGAEDSEERGRL